MRVVTRSIVLILALRVCFRCKLARCLVLFRLLWASFQGLWVLRTLGFAVWLPWGRFRVLCRPLLWCTVLLFWIGGLSPRFVRVLLYMGFLGVHWGFR